MKSRFILNVAALTLCSVSFSQTIDVQVHFPKGSDRMENESKANLIAWADANKSLHAEALVLRGHTDSDAEDKFNLHLSERRNKSVQRELIKCGFEKIEFTSFGESWPICNSPDEACMHDNRRVDVVLYDTDEEKFMLKQKRVAPDIHFVDCNKSQVVQGIQGTAINIPPNAFVHKDGSPATNVRIELREFYSMKDCIVNGLATMSNGEPLETGGMCYIRAFDGNEEVMLAPGEKLDIQFATQKDNPDAEMEMFTASLTSSGINWIPSGAKLSRGSKKMDNSRYRQKDGTYQRLFRIGSKDIAVNFGDSIPTVAYYSSTPEDKTSLTDYQRALILSALNGSGSLENSLEMSGLGWANCDRFARFPATADQIVNADVQVETQLYMVFDNPNILLAGNRNADGKYIFKSVPPGKRVTLIAYSEISDSESFFAMKEIMTSSDIESLKVQKISNEELDVRMKRFNERI